MSFNPIRAWNRFWFAPVSAKPLGAFRILFGLIAIFNVAMMFIDTDYWLTDLGVIQRGEAHELGGPLRHSILYYLRDPVSVRVVLWCTVASAVGLTLGWHTRIMSVIFYVLMLSIHQRNIANASGADVLLMCNAFYLMLAPCGAAYSLDARRARKRRGGTEADPLIAPWAQRLIQIQIAILYLTTAIWKTTGSNWITGTAIHFVLCNREVGRWDFSFLAGYPLLINIATYSGLAIEFALAFLLWFKAARPLVMLLGISLHFGIMFLVNIPVFGELSVAMYLTFLTSGEWETLTQRFNPLGWLAGLSSWAKSKMTFRLPARQPIGSVATSETVNLPAASA